MNIEETRKEKAKLALSYARKKGLPYYKYDYFEKLTQFEKIKKANFKNAIVNGEVLQLLHGIGLAWSYFPHHWGIKVENMKTPVDIFHDDDLLTKALISRMKWGGDTNVKDDGSLSDAQLRKAIRTASGAQAVSNFRPVAAATIYHKYANNGVVWDMSSGFGGRLFGALASGSVKKYIGCDPSTKTYEGLLNIKKEFSHIPMEIEIYKTGSECFVPNCKVDLCFTSPPYFNTEKYSLEESQSYQKFKTIEEWNEGFLRQTIKNCYSCLNKDGFMIINIANVKKHKTLESDTIKIAIEEGFLLLETLKLRLSSITKGGFKYEPIFVFKKL